MLFSKEECAIIESISMIEILSCLDLFEKIVFLRLFSENLSIRECAKSLNMSHVAILKKLKNMRIKIGYHLNA